MAFLCHDVITMPQARTKRSSKQAKTAILRVRATPEQMDAWQRAAALDRRTLSSWVQAVLDRESEEIVQ